MDAEELQRVAYDDGDPAYPLGIHLQAPLTDAPLTPQMQRFNEATSVAGKGISGVDVWNHHQLLQIC